MAAPEKSEQRVDEVSWPANARGVSVEQRGDSTDRNSGAVVPRAPEIRQEDSRASAGPRLREVQASEADSIDDDETADRRSPQPLTAREKLEQRLDEMYWPGYSKWSSAQRSDDESTERRTVDPPSAPATTPVDDRPKPKDPFASYSPELRAHMRHDDTLARLRYISPPAEEAESTSHADPSSLVESPGADERTSEAEFRDDVARVGLTADDSTASTSRLANETGDEPAASSPRPDQLPVDLEAAAANQKLAVDSVPAGRSDLLETDDVAAGIDSEPGFAAGIDEVAELEHEFVGDASPEEMDQYRRIREADDVDALADHSGMPREVIEEAKQHLFQREHDVAVGPDDVRHGYFTPDALYGDLWERVASGAELTDKNRVEFWSLLAHEYVESRLMAAGLPYRSPDPEAWDQSGTPLATSDYPSAHNTAPLSTRSSRMDLLILWDSSLDIPRGDLRVAEDLSNLDEVVRVAKEGLGL
ncbi:hypothetical protein AB0L64_10375 [Kribbella sp. NPDC051936]|uniref:hypothetical protein n=1 Tax=Kribbella sp. NPDC051936 TaxID=3154946 RepID=UPI003439F906